MRTPSLLGLGLGLVVVVTALVAGCPPGGGEGEGDEGEGEEGEGEEGEGEVSVEDAVALIAEGVIAQEERCRPIDFDFVVALDSVAATAERQTRELRIATLEAFLIASFIDPEFIEFHPESAGECRDALDATCVPDFPPGCRDAFRGTVADGGFCGNAQHCVDGDCVSDGNDCAICVPFLVRNQTCGEGLPSCEPGLACRAGLCTDVVEPPPPAALGAACVDACGDIELSGLACVDGFCVAATIQPLGEPCDEIGPRLCAGSNSTTACTAVGAEPGVCVQRPSSGPCLDPRAFCDETVSTCDFDTGQCVAVPLDGEACTRECALGSACRDGVCSSAIDGASDDDRVCDGP